MLVEAEDALDLAAEDVDGAAGGEAARHRLRQVDGDEAETRDAKQQLCACRCANNSSVSHVARQGSE